MIFWGHRFPPKNERTNSTLLLWYLRLTCFRSFFWRKSNDPKNHFEINWPLVKSNFFVHFFGRIEDKYQKDISKLIDLYFYSAAIYKSWSFQSQLFLSVHTPIRWIMKFHYYRHAKMIYISDFKIKGPFSENKYSEIHNRINKTISA